MLPVAAFAASVYVTNRRLSSESGAKAVMQATGFSPWRLARPVFCSGLIVAAMMTALTHFLVPPRCSSWSSARPGSPATSPRSF
ncbi:MAG: LptF/LptG family permease [Paracoccaceae bacterium]